MKAVLSVFRLPGLLCLAFFISLTLTTSFELYAQNDSCRYVSDSKILTLLNGSYDSEFQGESYLLVSHYLRELDAEIETLEESRQNEFEKLYEQKFAPVKKDLGTNKYLKKIPEYRDKLLNDEKAKIERKIQEELEGKYDDKLRASLEEKNALLETYPLLNVNVKKPRSWETKVWVPLKCYEILSGIYGRNLEFSIENKEAIDIMRAAIDSLPTEIRVEVCDNL